MSFTPTTVVMPAERPPSRTFQLTDLQRLLSARFSLIRAVFIVTVALTAIVLLLLPTLYSSSASVMIDQRKNNVADLSSVLSALPTDPSSLQNQIQILTSRDLAQEVISKLNLMDDTDFNPTLKPSAFDHVLKAINPRSWIGSDDTLNPASERDLVVNNFLKNVSVDAQGLSTTLTVTFTARNAEKAALIANTLVDTYVQDQLNAKRDIGKRTTQWLIDRTRLLAQQLQNEEAAVQRYKADNNITEAADGSSLADQQTNAISSQLVTARVDLAAKQATADRVSALMKSGNTADISQIVASPLIVQLRTQQGTLIAQESELATRYGPEHPKLQAAESQRRDLQQKIAQEVDRLAGSISNDLTVARAQVASLQNSLSQAEKMGSAQNLTRVKLKALESNAQSTRTMYEAFVTRLRETQDQDEIQNPDAHVISHAAVPQAPSSPKRMIILLASIPAGLLLGLLAALLVERFSVSTELHALPPGGAAVRTPTIVAQIQGANDPRAVNYVLDLPKSRFASETSDLLRRVLAVTHSPGARVIAVTGARDECAKTAMTIALARTASRANFRVAVIDGDLGNPNTAAAMGLRETRSGLIELLAGKASLSRTLRRDPRSGALLLAASMPVRDASAVLASEKMRQLIAHLRRTCDVVIMEVPSFSSGAEAQALIDVSDVVLVIARAEAMRSSANFTAVQALADRRAPPVGWVVAV